MATSYAISQLPAMAGAPASGDLFPLVDISDFSEAPTGTTKKLTVAQLFTAPTFTGTTTVSTLTVGANASVGGTLTTGGSITAAVNAASAALALDPIAGSASDNAQVVFKRNGVLKWQVGNNVITGSDAFDIYSSVAAGIALSINATTRAITLGGNLNLVAHNIVTSGGAGVTGDWPISGNATIGGTLGVTGAITGSADVHAGSGSAFIVGNSQLQTDGVGRNDAGTFQLFTNAIARWNVLSTGHLTANVDNTYDIGASGANRPRNLFLANNATIAGTATAGTSFVAPLFTGNLTGNVTGNVSGSAGSVAAANLTGSTLAAGVTASSLTSVGTLGSLSVSGGISAGQVNARLCGNGTTPSAAAQAGAGTSPTVSVVSNSIDTAGAINFTVGTTPAANSAMVVVTYTSSYGTAPIPTIQPLSAGGVVGRLYVLSYNATSFTVAMDNPSNGLIANFAYQVLGVA